MQYAHREKFESIVEYYNIKVLDLEIGDADTSKNKSGHLLRITCQAKRNTKSFRTVSQKQAYSFSRFWRGKPRFFEWAGVIFPASLFFSLFWKRGKLRFYKEKAWKPTPKKLQKYKGRDIFFE
jgi:hypothetical protein